MDAENFTYLSVYHDKKHCAARIKRFIVMFTKETCLLDCGCCNRKINCIHKAMPMWFLKQTEQLSRPWSKTIEVNQTDNCELMPKTCESLFYPPMDEEPLLPMIKYLHNFKKYDIDPLGNFKVFESKIPSNIAPKVSVCIDCQTPLSNPIKVCDNVCVITVQGMVTAFKSYVKKCNICELYYRYQGWNYGIHNYNDRLFLGFDVCLYLKEHLYHHNSVLSFSESKNSLFNLSVPPGDIVKVYILFDVLLNDLYSFYCNSCGYYLWRLVMDLNKKTAFKCAFEELEDGEEPKDTVDCDKFWENVELNAVANVFSDRKIKSLEIKPCLNCWLPYLGKAIRHGNDLLNTEFKKSNKSTGKLEADCRFMTEERILEMLSSEKLRKGSVRRKIMQYCYKRK